MLQALTSPVARSIAIGTILLAVAVAGVGAAKSHGRRLVLHARAECGAVYLSAWRDGAIPVPFEGDRLVPLTYKTRASVNDGCRWLGVETLTPTADGRRYRYKYGETILGCDPGATPFYKTPRTGIVTIED
jgi:hypothetical protein